MADDATPTNIRVAYPERDGIDIPNASLRAFCEHCLAVKPPDDYAERRHFDFAQLKSWLGYIMILDYLPAEDDFRYRLYGTHIADHVGFDLTGTLVGAMPHGLREFVARNYRESVERKAVLYTEHTRNYPRFTRDWHRVLCPVRDGDDIQVVTCNIPVNTLERAP